MRNAWVICSTVLGLLVSGCGGSASTTKRDDLAYLYGKDASIFRLSARVHHESETRSVIYFKLNTEDLLYKSNGGGEPYVATVRITYASFSSLNSRQLIDSSSTVISDRSGSTVNAQELIGSMELKNTSKEDYVIKVTAQDLNRETSSSVVLEVHNVGGVSRQDLLPMSPNGVPFFDDHVPPFTAVRIHCEKYAGRTLYGDRRRIPYRLPPPVFSSTTVGNGNVEPDSTFFVEVDSSGHFLVVTGASGSLHFRPDSNIQEGYTLFVLDESYPLVRTGKDMLAPLRYITSMQEYDKMARSENVRKAVEQFWLDAFGDRTNAREGIRTYYSRVENANRYFTSYIEGWRTDRGMVHIIYGPPGSIHRSDRSETWTYGEESSLTALNFTFVVRQNPIADNDLVLERDPMFKSSWYRNVESWRNGRVYSR